MLCKSYVSTAGSQVRPPDPPVPGLSGMNLIRLKDLVRVIRRAGIEFQ